MIEVVASEVVMDTLNVTWDAMLVGHLDRTAGRDLSFRYASSWLASPRARAISQSLPLQVEPFAGHLSRAWFANLLPEGEVREHVARSLGVSTGNEFALLGGLGGDCAGALRLLPGTPPDDEEAGLVPLDWDELEARISATPRPSLMAVMMRKGKLRLSLAGAQDKLPVHLVGNVLSLPTGSAASTHLLKIPGIGLPDLVQNEFFCLALAHDVGLTVPRARLAATRSPILIVERYDRAMAPDGSAVRLHQEDFCQALGLPPEAKYENEGGPALAQVFGMLERASASPLRDRRELLNGVLFNLIVGNADAHAKNFSLLYGGANDDTGTRLAPLYDLVCTAVYEDLSDKLPQKFGGEYRERQLRRRHWDRLADDIGVRPQFLRASALEMCRRISGRAPALADEVAAAHGGAPTLAKIVKVIAERVGRVEANCEATRA